MRAIRQPANGLRPTHPGTQGKFFMYGEPTGRMTDDVGVGGSVGWWVFVCVSRMAWAAVWQVRPCVVWCC